LANKSQDDAVRLDDASRRGFNILIALAIEEECRLIVTAGKQADGNEVRDHDEAHYYFHSGQKIAPSGPLSDSGAIDG
jgi:hypothetical protein